ncbi:MAG TPA: response regulator FixJ [Xanthobacteraceae bacterium]|nr:response regulator FixJ [Xanthobacteraceae bacterium]
MPADNIVYVIDDDEAMRKSLGFLLRAAKIEVQLFEAAAPFLEALPKLGTGCIITDVRMPGMTGIELLKRLRQLNVALPVIVITGHGDIALAVEAMKNGAADFLEKPFDDEVLLTAIRNALDVQANTVARKASHAEIHEKLATLTNREREVLDGLVAGQQNKVIAYDLGISPRTVEIYRANVMTKMGANSLSDLVRMALVGDILN